MNFPFRPLNTAPIVPITPNTIEILSYDEGTDEFVCLVNEEHEQRLLGVLVYYLTGGGEPADLVGQKFVAAF